MRLRPTTTADLPLKSMFNDCSIAITPNAVQGMTHNEDDEDDDDGEEDRDEPSSNGDDVISSNSLAYRHRRPTFMGPNPSTSLDGSMEAKI
mmetsp:Transcript_7835/g.15130  ORF Transcript_7835/g.15130 Transcript_7835/m.15130 type:complete len:91 (+) Transcript_7835:77-349(+)